MFLISNYDFILNSKKKKINLVRVVLTVVLLLILMNKRIN